MSRRLVVTGPLEALRTFDLRGKAWVSEDVVRSSQLSPLELARTMTARDEVVLLPGWEVDHDACSLVALGLWLRLRFYRLDDGVLARCTPRSPVLEFVDGLETALGPADAVDDLWNPAA